MIIKTRTWVILIILTLLLSASIAFSRIKGVAAAYVYGYPLVLMEHTRLALLGDQYGSNQFAHNQVFPDHTFRNVVRPNNDTLYSIAWLDLSEEPQVLTVPDTHGRYYVMPLMDAWTNVFAMVGKRATGTGAGTFLIAGPDWRGEAPPDVTRIDSPTNMVWLIGRIQTNGPQDIPAVAALQQQFTLASLSRWREGGANDAVISRGEGGGDAVDPYRQLQDMSAAEFLDSLARLMAEQYPAAEDKPLLSRLAGIGVVPGQPYIGGPLDLLHNHLADLALDITRGQIRKRLEEGRELENGWRVTRDKIGVYGTDYGVRAGVAMVGLGALPPVEATYPSTSLDGKGRPLDGEHAYRLHFAAGETPPARAFWSLTLYDEEGFLVANPIGCYAIGDRDALQYNEDGSLDIHIQHTEPSSGRTNWLPAPADPFALTLRIYYPQERFLNGSWHVPPVQRIPQPHDE